MSADGKRRVVGVLGGMGPEATIAFMQRVVDLTPADDDSDHVPLLVDNNTRIPSRIKAIIEGVGDDPQPVLCNMARRLAGWGAEALAMPCNTAHYYAAAVARSVDIPLLDMVELAAARVAEFLAPTGRPAGMLCSPAVRMTGVFDRALDAVGVQAHYPQDDAAVLECIRAVKAGHNDQATTATLNAVIDGLCADGAGLVVIACSELSILKQSLDCTLPKLDSLDVLAQAVVDFSSGSGTGSCSA